ncbi:hypothetical protein CEXT_448761, partial [Caerostris extrusa]
MADQIKANLTGMCNANGVQECNEDRHPAQRYTMGYTPTHRLLWTFAPGLSEMRSS